MSMGKWERERNMERKVTGQQIAGMKIPTYDRIHLQILIFWWDDCENDSTFKTEEVESDGK